MANSFQVAQEPPEMESIAELAENIVYRLRDCPDLVVRKTIREIAREFCRETKCLTVVRPISLNADQAHYPVYGIYNGVVVEVREVFIGNRKLLRDIDYRVHKSGTLCVVLNPRFVPTANTDADDASDNAYNTLFVKAVEIPRLDSEDLPSFFVEVYGDAIIYGVLSRLYAQKGAKWADEIQAPDMRRRYENMKSEARMSEETPRGGRFIDTSQIL